MKLGSKFEIQGNRVVFNVHADRHDMDHGKRVPQTLSLSEKELLARMTSLKAGGRNPSVEETALFALQRQSHMSPSGKRSR